MSSQQHAHRRGHFAPWLGAAGGTPAIKGVVRENIRLALVSDASTSPTQLLEHDRRGDGWHGVLHVPDLVRTLGGKLGESFGGSLFLQVDVNAMLVVKRFQNLSGNLSVRRTSIGDVTRYKELELIKDIIVMKIVDVRCTYLSTDESQCGVPDLRSEICRMRVSQASPIAVISLKQNFCDHIGTPAISFRITSLDWS
jgi:hypothetical protein